MSRICLYDIRLPERDRWVPGDRVVRSMLRRALRGTRPSGVDKVTLNLCLGLDQLGLDYAINRPFQELQPEDRVGVLGRGRQCLMGYNRENPILAGVALMTHPSEWPTLLQDYPVVKYLQHSPWARDVYRPYFGDNCALWPVGIDTEIWRPIPSLQKTTDFLIYNKIRWHHEQYKTSLLTPIRQELSQRQLTFRELRYGTYTPESYQQALGTCRAMIFLCEHESQGIAYQEALASGVPILAWDQGQCLDPNRFHWGTPHIPASSVPFWDERCGVKFDQGPHFVTALEEFLDKQQSYQFNPRAYILENLTLADCAQQYVDLLNAVQAQPAGCYG
jgi:hypothetical protein